MGLLNEWINSLFSTDVITLIIAIIITADITAITTIITTVMVVMMVVAMSVALEHCCIVQGSCHCQTLPAIVNTSLL